MRVGGEFEVLRDVVHESTGGFAFYEGEVAVEIDEERFGVADVFSEVVDARDQRSAG